VGTFRRSMCW